MRLLHNVTVSRNRQYRQFVFPFVKCSPLGLNAHGGKQPRERMEVSSAWVCAPTALADMKRAVHQAEIETAFQCEVRNVQHRILEQTVKESEERSRRWRFATPGSRSSDTQDRAGGCSH